MGIKKHSEPLIDIDDILNANSDITIRQYNKTYHKPLKIASNISSADWNNELINDSTNYINSYVEPLYNAIIQAKSSIFEWKGLPKEIPEKMMEYFLNTSGRLKMIKVNGKYMIVHIAIIKWDNYYNPIKTKIVEPFASKYINNKTTELFQNVELKNNTMGRSVLYNIHKYLDILNEKWEDYETHLSTLVGSAIYKIPFTKSLATDTNKLEEISLNQWATSGLPIKAVNFDAQAGTNYSPIEVIPYLDRASSFDRATLKYENKCLSLEGLPNNNLEDKTERTNTVEVKMQNLVENAILKDNLNARREFCNKANELWGLNITVDYNEELFKPDSNSLEIENKGGEKDE